MAHVKDFGAVGDGKADDTAELQHAINDGERLIVIPAGTYRITKPLRVDLDKMGCGWWARTAARRIPAR
jgi:polygalacturonase